METVLACVVCCVMLVAFDIAVTTVKAVVTEDE